MLPTAHVSFRAPQLLRGMRSKQAVARSLRTLHGVSTVILDATSGAVAVRFDPRLTTAAAVRARVHLPMRRSRTTGVLLAAARWSPWLALLGRAAFAAIAG